jgi:hypothetical protein
MGNCPSKAGGERLFPAGLPFIGNPCPWIRILTASRAPMGQIHLNLTRFYEDYGTEFP